MRRGEIWSAATGSGFGGKPRPVVILQSDDFSETGHVIVVLCQTALGEPDDVRPRIEPDANNGLQVTTDVAVDLLVTVAHHKFGKPIGRMSNRDFARVESALLIILGYAR